MKDRTLRDGSPDTGRFSPGCFGPVRNNRGSALITAIIVLSFLAVIGVSLITLISARTVYSQVKLDRLKALYIAESGIAHSVWALKENIEVEDDPGNIGRTAFAGGYYEVHHDFYNSTITSTGEFNGVKRTVQIKYGSI